MITDVPLDADPAPDAGNIDLVPVHARLGTFPYQLVGPDGVAGTADDEPAMGGRTIVVQPFGGYQETQIEFCDTRGWGVSQQCNRANVYGFHAGDYQDTWKQPWTPVPVQGDVAGFDRPGAVGRLRVDGPRVRLHGRQAGGLRRAAERAHAGRPGDGRLPRRRLSLRDRRDDHARRHRAPVRARLQPLPQRSPHGRLRHRAERRRRPAWDETRAPLRNAGGTVAT